MGLSEDRPINRLDEDRLHRRAFAEQVARYIHSAPAGHGLVVSAMAPWGNGKTSFLNFSLVPAIFEYISSVGIQQVPADPLAFADGIHPNNAGMAAIAVVGDQPAGDLQLEFGRRLVDAAIAVIIGHLFLRQGAVNDRKKRVAKRFIETRLPLKAIASACGFANANHFSKVFRRLQNLSPASYRRTMR